MEKGDSIALLSSKFGVSMDSIETVNGMSGPNGVVVGDVYYIPLNSSKHRFPSFFFLYYCTTRSSFFYQIDKFLIESVHESLNYIMEMCCQS